jgi:hypothetical protein
MFGKSRSARIAERAEHLTTRATTEVSRGAERGIESLHGAADQMGRAGRRAGKAAAGKAAKVGDAATTAAETAVRRTREPATAAALAARGHLADTAEAAARAVRPRPRGRRRLLLVPLVGGALVGLYLSPVGGWVRDRARRLVQPEQTPQTPATADPEGGTSPVVIPAADGESRELPGTAVVRETAQRAAHQVREVIGAMRSTAQR